MLSALFSQIFGRRRAQPVADEDRKARAAGLVRDAWALREEGEPAKAVEQARAALEIWNDSAQAHLLLATQALGGETYFKVLRRIHAELRPRTYLEIGIFKGASLALVDAAATA